MVLAFGRDVGQLPFLEWKNRWISPTRFTKRIAKTKQFVLYVGELEYQDEDEDQGVTRRQFDNGLDFDSNIGHVKLIRSLLGSSEWLGDVDGLVQTTPEQLIEELLAKSWGEVDHKIITMVVGDVDGHEIMRDVSIYTRVEDFVGRPQNHNNAAISKVEGASASFGLPF